MKHSIISFFLLLLVQLCNSQNKTEEINFLNKFYKSYITKWDNNKEINSLKQKNLSEELVNSITELTNNGELDYDPIINSQDTNEDILKTLKIKYLIENDFYEISYFNSYKKNKNYIYLKLIKKNKSFIINDIKVNDIKSILNLSLPKEANNASLKNNFEITSKGNDIIVNYNGKQIRYKNFIVNEMSVSTTINKEKDDIVTLVYEYNASSTKMKEQYKLSFINNELFINYKESVKFNSKGIAICRVYSNNYPLKNHSFEDIQSIGNKLIFSYNDKKPIAYFYNNKSIRFGEVSYKSSLEDFFVEYPKKPKIEEIHLQNIEEANNIAYYLEQYGAYEDSIFLLTEILKKNPDRVVAYLNLADSIWNSSNKNEAKKMYKKYLSLMKDQKKDLDKIPKRVYERIE
ncbi:hypothetical protein BWK59_05260 [Flavobacterium davisii]|uniref:Uncharacterized protein n=1 Tax=Flavobacterium davisii TaxID=2906077 RepID=A0A246GJJ0_9FLAO|nr:tetratricopeptide repeat protein [Flavobacterium davisii]OWP84469.1 hypothetical protein BWK59_05260 [Flavobacterium davisii]